MKFSKKKASTEADAANVSAEIPAEHQETSKTPSVNKKFSPKWFAEKFRGLSKVKKALVVGVALLVVLMAVPITRYKVLGLFIKKEVLIYTIDSGSGDIVYNAHVTIDGKEPFCGGDKPPYPNCFAKVPVGKHKLKISAAYYDSVEKDITVELGKSGKQNIEVPMTANGSAVYFNVTDKISGKPLEKAHIKVGQSESLTTEGRGLIFTDFSASTLEAEVSLDGYNSVKTTVEVVPGKIQQDIVELTLVPAGKLYFLSKLSGKIDVVKANLDGTERVTVLAGTGKEEEAGTVLLASRDWKYMALLSAREGKAKLYLIDTATDKLTTIDEGEATFSITGWLDHDFIYTVNRENVEYWQPKRQALKSFNASSKKLTILDETGSEGPNADDQAHEYYGEIYALKGAVVFVKNWDASYYSMGRLNDKKASVVSIKGDGSSKTTLKTLALPAGTNATGISFESRAYEAGGIYYKSAFEDVVYEYEDGKFETTDEITVDNFYEKVYPTFLQSPNGKENFWSESRDGKNTLFVGDEDGENGKEIVKLSELTQYGWFTDDYLLVSKNNSELYIMAKDGVREPIKVTDYHKPVFTYYGYGGGYGGL
jgi:hypothetical protein